MKKAFFIYLSLALCITFFAVNEAPSSVVQTHSITGKIVVEGRETYDHVKVWVDSREVVLTDSLGDYEIVGLEDGEHIIKACFKHCLVQIVDTVQVSGEGVAGVNGTLLAIDIVEDGRINLSDAGEILLHYLATPDSGSWDEVLDLDNNSVIDSLDVDVLMVHWKEIDDSPRPSSKILITEPNRSTKWRCGQLDVPIHWETGDLDGNVAIRLYQGGGPVHIISSSTPNDGSYTDYDVPINMNLASDYMVRIFLDYYNVDESELFEIYRNIEVTEPSSDTLWYIGQPGVPISWTTEDIGGTVSIVLYNGNQVVDTIASSTPNDGSYTDYDVPMDLEDLGGGFRIRVYFDEYFNDYSDYFGIGRGIRIIEPTSESIWYLGQWDVPIRWAVEDVGDAVSITLCENRVPVDTITLSTPNDGSYSDYDVPMYLIPGIQYQILVACDEVYYDYSSDFQIRKLITISYPNSYTKWYLGQANVMVHWTADEFDGDVSIHLYKGGSLVDTISTSAPNNGSYIGYDVPLYLAPGTDYSVFVTYLFYEGSFDYSSDFEILPDEPPDSTGWFQQGQLPSGVYLSDVSSIDANTGTAVGLPFTILRTTDGGDTWVMQLGVGETWPNSFEDVSFTDAMTGTAVGYFVVMSMETLQYGMILRTTDGGDTWVFQKGVLSGIPSLFGVSFIDTDRGIAVGMSGTILLTTDGGATWIEQTSGTGNTLRGVSLTDVNTATVVGRYGTILRTTDGGATWIKQTSGTTQHLRDVSFTDANTGTVVGTYGTILRTTDGGATWVSQISGTSKQLSGVSFVDANTGTVVGGGGLILRTTDGGATWVIQTSGTGHGLSGVSFVDANTGWAVGGTILRTTTGGVD